MIALAIPGRGAHQLARLALDLNGTLALDGRLVEAADGVTPSIVVALDLLLDTTWLMATLRC
jgi:hypothetical protein